MRADVRGQASIEYVGLLATLLVLFAGAAAAVTAASDIPRRVTHTIRTGLCIVGGDVCRPSDAAAAGLAPCIVTEKAKGAGVTVAIGFLRVGESGEWSAARRSDGTVLITHSDDRRVGAGAGVGFELGSVEVGADGSLDLDATTGEAWELPSVDAAARLLAAVRARKDVAPPTWRFGDAGEHTKGRLGFRAFGTELTGLEASWRAGAGLRTGRGEQTLYVHAGIDMTGPLDLVPGADDGSLRGSSAAPGGSRSGPVLIALTRDAGGLKELAFRTVAEGTQPGDVTETTARLDLRDPANRAVADRLLRVRLPWPPSVARDLRAVVRRAVTHGTVERAVYAVEDHSHELVAAARLALELGIEAESVDVARRLVDAVAWTRGSPERRRADCVGDGR